MISQRQFQKLVWNHYKQHGRHDMPWRRTRDPYRILISEVMLQQTQVSRVEKFYPTFVRMWPTFQSLAKARTADVLRVWQGLGYNRRALALQKLAQIIVKNYGGKLPANREALELLPGIGRGTSGSLMTFAFNEPVVFIETNIRRVFIHHFTTHIRTNVSDDVIVPFVLKLVDQKRPREWYWALMDYGAMLGEKSRGRAVANPNLRSRHYVRQPKFVGSDRELRGKLLKLLLREKKISFRSLAKRFAEPTVRINRISGDLVREGFLVRRGGFLWSL